MNDIFSIYDDDYEYDDDHDNEDDALPLDGWWRMPIGNIFSLQ